MAKTDDDAALRAALAAGAPDAFAAAYDRFAPGLLAAAWGMLGSREDAEDAVQDVFVGLVRSRGSVGGVANLKAYLFASLRHAAARRWSARRRAAGGPGASGAAGGAVAAGDAAGGAAGDESTARLERALAALPAAQREVLALKIDGGLTFAEVAAVLGLSGNTVASRYRYALEKLRARLKE